MEHALSDESRRKLERALGRQPTIEEVRLFTFAEHVLRSAEENDRNNEIGSAVTPYSYRKAVKKKAH
jgi:hypothetical protein